MIATIIFIVTFVFLLIYPKYIFTSKLAGNYVRLHSKYARIDWKEHVRAAVPYENNVFITDLMDIRILGKASRAIGVLFLCAVVNTIIMRSVFSSDNEFYIFVTTTLNALVIVVSFVCDIILAMLCCKYLDKKNLLLFTLISPLCFFMLSGGLNRFFSDNKDALLGTYTDEQY